MSSEDKANKITTGKKSYSEAVSPSKKKKKQTSNSFFSLSEDSKFSFSLPPRRISTMGKKVATTKVSPAGSLSEPSLHEKLEEWSTSIAAESAAKTPMRSLEVSTRVGPDARGSLFAETVTFSGHCVCNFTKPTSLSEKNIWQSK